MAQVLVTGLSSDLVQALRARLGGLKIDECCQEAELLTCLKSADYSMLVLNDDFGRAGNWDLILQVRSEFPKEQLAVIYCVHKESVDALISDSVDQMDTVQLLFHPLDRVELANEISTALQLPPVKVEVAASEAENKLLGLIAQMWEQQRGYAFDQVSGIEEVVAALQEGRLTLELQKEAERLAHKLAGSLGTYGLTEASRISGEIERMFACGELIEADKVSGLSDLVATLRLSLEHSPANS